MADFLQERARAGEERVRVARQRTPEAELSRRAGDRSPARPLVLDAAGFDLIAELKRHSPSVGALGQGLVGRAQDYVSAGVAAISVLTEPDAFRGSLADLNAVSDAVELPTMRKDFLVDPYQVLEARAAGASGVLLIARILDDTRLEEMIDAAAATGQFVLIEAFDASDLSRASAVASRGTRAMVGLNCRNLATLEVDFDRFRALRDAFPKDTPRVAESGLETAADAAAVAGLGYRLALVGSALMRTDDPQSLATEMIRAGRKEARSCA